MTYKEKINTSYGQMLSGSFGKIIKKVASVMLLTGLMLTSHSCEELTGAAQGSEIKVTFSVTGDNGTITAVSDGANLFSRHLMDWIKS